MAFERDEWVIYRRPLDAHGIEALHGHFTGQVYGRHTHDGYGLGVTEEGVQSFNCRGTSYFSTAGRIMIFNLDEPHDGQAPTGDGFTYRMLYIPEAVVRDAAEELRQRHVSAPPAAREPVIEDPLLASAVTELHQALVGGGSKLFTEHALQRTLELFLRRHADDSGTGYKFRPRNSLLALHRVRDYLRDAPVCDDVSSEDIVRIAGISRFHLGRAFAKQFGMPPHAYRVQVRLSSARAMLASGQPIADVAAALGFADQSHFHRRFRRAFGITPRQYIEAAA